MWSTPAPVIEVSPAHAQKSTEDGQTTIKGGGWLVFAFTNPVYHSYMQISSTPAAVVEVSLATAQKSTEDGLTRIQGDGS